MYQHFMDKVIRKVTMIYTNSSRKRKLFNENHYNKQYFSCKMMMIVKWVTKNPLFAKLFLKRIESPAAKYINK